MIDGTFAFVRGIGPARARELLSLGIRCWSDFPQDGLVVSAPLDERIRQGVAGMRRLLEARRWEEIATRLPVREHWRFYPHLCGEITFLDIETAADGSVTVIGLYDANRGPRLYVRGHNLGEFVYERPTALMTFNGAAFDLPVLRRTFPGWEAPLHIDLRVVFRQLRERGGLKALEDRFGFGRPAHLKGVNGMDAVALWHRFRLSRDAGALRRLLEYNLYDAVQLRSLAETACERLSGRGGRPWSPDHPFARGDVLLDLSRAVETIVGRSGCIEPEQFHDEERRSLRFGA